MANLTIKLPQVIDTDDAWHISETLSELSGKKVKGKQLPGFYRSVFVLYTGKYPEKKMIDKLAKKAGFEKEE